jgi:hypothetical protein
MNYLKNKEESIIQLSCLCDNLNYFFSRKTDKRIKFRYIQGFTKIKKYG